MYETELEVSLTERAGASEVTVRGEVDFASSPRLWAVLVQALARRPERLVLDLGDVTFLDLPGLDVLVRAVRQGRAGDCAVVVRSVSPPIHRVLDLTGMSPVLAGDG